MTAISLSLDPESRHNYGPYVPGIGATNPGTGEPIRYNNLDDLRAVLDAYGSSTAAFIVEPIQGEAGVVVPDDDYLARAAELCKQHNVLLICDEIQTGVARTGRMLCSQWAGIKPDMVTLGKAISGGMYPVSCVLADKAVMGVIEPGTHGSTYGGNPLGCAVSIRALELVEEEGLVEKAERLGNIFREGVEAFKSPVVRTVRGKGLLNAVVIDDSKTNGRTAWDLCLLLKEKGVLVSAIPCFPWNRARLTMTTRRNRRTATSSGLRRPWSSPRTSCAAPSRPLGRPWPSCPLPSRVRGTEGVE
jgi:ornithine--oxo-acid transaminase